MLGVVPVVEDRKKDDPTEHAFGTPENHSHVEPIVGRVVIKLPVVEGVMLPIRAFIVDGRVPLTLGKDTLRFYKGIEAHDGNWLELSIKGQEVRIPTQLNRYDNHSRIVLTAEAVRIRELADTTIMKDRDEATSLVARIHARTHFYPTTCKKLLQRSGKWKAEMEEEVREVMGKFLACLKSGDPHPSRKFIFSKLHLGFNDRVYMDIFFWKDHQFLHVVDFYTGYSEVAILDSKRLPELLQQLKNMWLMRHDDPREIWGDQEFNRQMVKNWASKRGIIFRDLPARRHNKVGDCRTQEQSGEGRT